MIGNKVLVLAERIKKKAAPGKFYQQSVQNISYFNKDEIFIIRKIQPIDGMKYYWLKDVHNNRTTENLQKDFKGLNYLLLGVNLLCDCMFYCIM